MINDEMTVDEALDELGWTHADLADRLGIHRVTVTRAIHEPPKYITAYLDLAVAIHRLWYSAR